MKVVFNFTVNGICFFEVSAELSFAPMVGDSVIGLDFYFKNALSKCDIGDVDPFCLYTSKGGASFGSFFECEFELVGRMICEDYLIVYAKFRGEDDFAIDRIISLDNESDICLFKKRLENEYFN